MKINTTNTTNKNKKRVAITTIICAMVVFAMVVVGCGIKKNSTVAEAEADVIATVGTTIDTTETVEETTETIVEETTEIVEETTETVEETTETVEEPSVETPSENTTTETETPSENKPSNTTTETPSTTTTTTTTTTPSVPTHTHNYKSTVTNATCTSQGYTTYTCECGDSYVSNYTSGSHNYSNGACTTCGTADPNVQRHWCGTPMQMMSGYIFHPAEGYYAPYVHFSNGEELPYGDGTWINAYMTDNGITSYSLVENHWVETTPEWREENVTQMCCPSCRTNANNFYAY